ncbi:hypothetical protein QX776_03170 [Alteromonadaceae bacterium BrNp21-10]|nr:hypothetical protein [Alteromonadaceae bacterium BrNp21-10]
MDPNSIEYQRKYLIPCVQSHTGEGVLLKFMLIRVSRGAIRLAAVFDICKKQGFTPSQARFALGRLENAKLLQYSLNNEVAQVELTDLGREVFKEVEL